MKTVFDIGKDLNVSRATIANWVKTGVIPSYPNGDFFEENVYNQIIIDIKNNYKKLQKRANRSNNTSVCLKNNASIAKNNKKSIEKIGFIFEKSGLSLSDFMCQLCIFFLEKHELIILKDKKINSENPDFTRFLINWNSDNHEKQAELFADFGVNLTEIANEDAVPEFLGTIYESLRSIGEKSVSGAFYTPQKLVADIDIPLNCSVLDPCGGTGILLLNTLKKAHNPALITLRDIDKLALNIAKVNFCLFFGQIHTLINTEYGDILAAKNEGQKFDFIATNPPYGAKFLPAEKRKLLQTYSFLQTSETFSISLYNCLEKMNETGKLSFILPESFLYTDAHFAIRELVLNLPKSIKIIFFGAAFKGVMSKIIRLDIDNNTKKNEINVVYNDLNWLVGLDFLAKNNYKPPFISSKNDLYILEKVMSVASFNLAEKCRFGLGIVTGNNDLHLKTVQSEGFEPIFRGKDLQAFGFSAPKNYIAFAPEKLQQVAPIELYRAPKICYRFISDNLITVADFEGVLVLNSVNFFAPIAPILNEKKAIKALSAFLNSAAATFIYQCFFKAVKVLRSHIEQIQIPLCFYENIEELSFFYDAAAAGKDVKDELNCLVWRMYGISEELK